MTEYLEITEGTIDNEARLFVDGLGVIGGCNSEACLLTGVSRGELIGRAVAEIPAALRRRFIRSELSGTGTVWIERQERGNGEWRSVYCNGIRVGEARVGIGSRVATQERQFYKRVVWPLVRKGEWRQVIANCNRALEKQKAMGVARYYKALAYVKLGYQSKADRDCIARLLTQARERFAQLQLPEEEKTVDFLLEIRENSKKLKVNTMYTAG